MKSVVLLDFHNTLATCDAWLDLEIRTLPALALRALVKEGLVSVGAQPTEDDLPYKEAERVFRVLRQGVRESGLELSAVEGTRRVLGQMGIVPHDSDLARVVQMLEYSCLPEVEIVEGVGAALQQLRDSGYLLGVVSSAGYPPFVELALEKLSLRPFFSEIVTSAGEGLYKSDPELFKRAVSKLGVSPGEAVHVGDHPVYDVQAAQKAGLSAIWYTGHTRRTAHLHSTNWAEMSAAGASADAVIEDMSELVGAVQGLAIPH